MRGIIKIEKCLLGPSMTFRHQRHREKGAAAAVSLTPISPFSLGVKHHSSVAKIGEVGSPISCSPSIRLRNIR